MYQPRLRISPDLLRLLTEATELKAWIAQAVVDVAWLPALQRDTAARLAHSSTSIEGNPLALPEVEALARGETIGAPDKAAQEVKNYLSGMRWVWSRKPGSQIGEKDLLHLHGLLTSKVLPPDQAGSYKSKTNRIVDPRGRTVYTPPGPEQAMPLTRALVAWINGPEASRLHPVMVNAVAHHRLVSIHPFADGNGRISRALGVWLLYTRGFDTQHLFALDEFYESNRQLYYGKIQQSRDSRGPNPGDDISPGLVLIRPENARSAAKKAERRSERPLPSLQTTFDNKEPESHSPATVCECARDRSCR